MKRSQATRPKVAEATASSTPVVRHDRQPRRAEAPLPYDPVNEMILLAAAMRDPRVRDKHIASIPPDSFFGKGHAAIWSMLRELHARKLDFDPMTARQLGAGQVDEAYLARILELYPTVPPNLSHHVEMLQWDRARVEASRGPVEALLKALRNPREEPERVRSLARQVGTAFEGFGSQRYLRDPNELVREQAKSLRDRRTGRACFPYGIEGLDIFAEGEPRGGEYRLMPGAAPKQVTVITGVSGSGKTTVTAQIALAMAEQERKVLFGAWEAGSGMTLELLACISLGMSRGALTTGNFTAEDEEALVIEMDRLSTYVRFFELPFGRSRGEKNLNDRNLDLIHQYIADSGCEVFVADLWRRTLRQFDADEEEYALYRQQAIAQETNTHNILIHQQRLKDLETRADKRPTREGLKGSGAWVEVPDTILGVHRAALFKSLEDNVLEVDILKQRHGPWPLAVEFRWEPDTGKLSQGRSIEYARPGEQSEFDESVGRARNNMRERSHGRR